MLVVAQHWRRLCLCLVIDFKRVRFSHRTMNPHLCCVLLMSFTAVALSQSEPEATDADDFYRSRFGNGDTSRMRVILGDTEGWVNPHDMLGLASKDRHKETPEQQQKQPKLKKSSGAFSDPISEDTASPATRAEMYSEIRARSAAESSKFSRYPVSEADETETTQAVPPPVPSCERCDCDCKALRRETKKCGEQVKQLRLSQVLADGEHDREFIYLRRLALNVIYSAKFGGDEMPSNVKFEILLSSDDVKMLEKLAMDAGTKSSQLEQRLSAILTSSVVTPEELPHGANALLGRLAQAWGQTMGPVDVRLAVPVCAFLGVLLLVLIRGRPWKVFFLMAALYFLLLSFVWHWALCYQVEHARRDAYIMRHDVPPEHCRPGHTPGWFQWILGPRESSAECEKYYESLHVDPVWQVNPLLVLTELLSKALFDPLANFGTALGKLTRNFAEHQTWWSLFNNIVNVICIGVLGLFAAMIFAKLFLFFITHFYWSKPERQQQKQRQRFEDVHESDLQHPVSLSSETRRKFREQPYPEVRISKEKSIEEKRASEESSDEGGSEDEECDDRAGGDTWHEGGDAAKLEKT